MTLRNLHDKPFDKATIAKLEIFEDYAEAWIPTFVMSDFRTICIFDFFAGTGYDKNAIPGSPIRILEKIKKHFKIIVQQEVKVKVFLNELNSLKFVSLKSSCERYIEENSNLEPVIELNFLNEDFDICFKELIPFIEKYPSLVYLDQNGIKFLSEKYFLELEKTNRTDFLYFVSASYFWRFGETKEFKMHLNLDISEAKRDPYCFIHRNLLSQLKKMLPKNTKLKLYPYSLKKGANIHGIIFGASNVRAVDKFLTIAWKRNEVNGEANFDIDEDLIKGQFDLWGGHKLTKKETFQQRLREKVLSSEIKTNIDAFKYTLDEGHISKHAADELIKMKKENLITYNGHSPLITYENIKNKKLIEYKIL